MEQLSEYQKVQKWLETYDWDNDSDAYSNLATICEALQEIEKYKDAEKKCVKECGCCLQEVICKYQEFLEHMHELAEYWKLEEQGLLLRLPCKVGDIVYAISTLNDTGKVYECIVKFIKVDSSEKPYFVAHCTELNLGVTLFFSSFGKTVFLTKEEAEQKLAEMEG